MEPVREGINFSASPCSSLQCRMKMFVHRKAHHNDPSFPVNTISTANAP
jgi:hypothetical protein